MTSFMIKFYAPVLIFTLIPLLISGCMSSTKPNPIGQVATFSSSSNELELKPWATLCEEDSDCVLVEANCGCCGYRPINVAFVEHFNREKKAQCPVSARPQSCVQANEDCTENIGRTLCRDGRCVGETDTETSFESEP